MINHKIVFASNFKCHITVTAFHQIIISFLFIERDLCNANGFNSIGFNEERKSHFAHGKRHFALDVLVEKLHPTWRTAQLAHGLLHTSGPSSYSIFLFPTDLKSVVPFNTSVVTVLHS